MATNYRHQWGSTGQEQRAPRTSKAVPAVAPTYTTCPHCSTTNGVAELVAYGCWSCQQMPNAAGRRQ